MMQEQFYKMIDKDVKTFLKEFNTQTIRLKLVENFFLLILILYIGFYQYPNETALSIGKHAPIPNQTANINPKIKTKLAIGRRNGFWNLFTFSIKGTVINPAGTAAIAKTPNNLLGNIRNKLKVGKKYHSGKISSGVLNGSAGSPI